eukprot:1119136-Amphidinium_carterae.1
MDPGTVESGQTVSTSSTAQNQREPQNPNSVWKPRTEPMRQRCSESVSMAPVSLAPPANPSPNAAQGYAAPSGQPVHKRNMRMKDEWLKQPLRCLGELWCVENIFLPPYQAARCV